MQELIPVYQRFPFPGREFAVVQLQEEGRQPKQFQSQRGWNRTLLLSRNDSDSHADAMALELVLVVVLLLQPEMLLFNFSICTNNYTYARFLKRSRLSLRLSLHSG